MGPLLSSSADSIIDQARRDKMTALVFSKRSYFDTGRGIFRFGPTIESQVYSLLDACHRYAGLKKYAVIYPATLVGQEYAALFSARIRKLGLNLVYQNTYYPQDDNSLVSIAEDLEASDVEAIFLPDDLKVAARFWINLSPQARTGLKLLGPAGWDNAEEISHSRTVLNGAIFVSPFFIASERPLIRKFIETYKSRYGASPDFLAAQGFDAATLVAGAMKKQRKESMSFAQALQDIDFYDGLTGKISVETNGEVSRVFTVVQLQNQRLVDLGSSQELSFVMRGNEQAPAVEEEKIPTLGDELRQSYSTEQEEPAHQ